MPRLQTFVSGEIEQEIVDIINVKRSEGATKDEANVSNTTSMLIELGIRVYKLQRVNQEGSFSQAELNKIMLENMIKTSLICQKLLRINSNNSEVKGVEEFAFNSMAVQIRSAATDVVNHFFPNVEDN